MILFPGLLLHFQIMYYLNEDISIFGYIIKNHIARKQANTKDMQQLKLFYLIQLTTPI
jgi:hypothetical protein